MSYGIWLEADLGGPEPLTVWSDWNYTSNCARMWRLAMPRTDGLAGMEGKVAGSVAPTLAEGIAYMERHSEPFRRLDPPNGWGDFDGQLAALRTLLAAFRSAPDARVGISR